MPPGVISPDGTTAALIDRQTAAAHLCDLTSGADHPLSVLTNQSSFDLRSLVWSPDSRWLFIAAANGHPAVVDARIRQVRDLGALAAYPQPDRHPQRSGELMRR